MLEKDLENATEAGLELERMLREVLSSNNEVNPLAQSVEDLQARLDAQQAANESLTNALNLKAQEVRIICLQHIVYRFLFYSSGLKKQTNFSDFYEFDKFGVNICLCICTNITDIFKDDVTYISMFTL